MIHRANIQQSSKFWQVNRWPMHDIALLLLTLLLLVGGTSLQGTVSDQVSLEPAGIIDEHEPSAEGLEAEVFAKPVIDTNVEPQDAVEPEVEEIVEAVETEEAQEIETITADDAAEDDEVLIDEFQTEDERETTDENLEELEEVTKAADVEEVEKATEVSKVTEVEEAKEVLEAEEAPAEEPTEEKVEEVKEVETSVVPVASDETSERDDLTSITPEATDEAIEENPVDDAPAVLQPIVTDTSATLAEGSFIKHPNVEEIAIGSDAGSVSLTLASVDVDKADGEVLTTAEALAAMLKISTQIADVQDSCLLYTSPRPRDATLSRMPSSA